MITSVTASKLDAFCRKLTFETITRLREHKLDCKANLEHAIAEWNKGNKYAKIVNKSSVRYFVELSTGTIFAAKSWAAPNRNRSYGTLDTMDEFNWGDYSPTPLATSDWSLKPTRFGYATAVRK